MATRRSADLRLVIFDCDGVLVDSEPIANRVFAQMLNELGLRVTLEDMYSQFVGHPMAYCMDLVERMLGSPVPSGFSRELQARTFDAFKRELRPMPGVVEVLHSLRMPCCVASSGDHEKMRFTLGLTGLLPWFEGRIFSVTDVRHGKPAPDIYLHAAREMGVSPSSCLVVEDSCIGARAGVAAGMVVYGFAVHTSHEALRRVGVARTFEHMRELQQLIQLC